MAAHALQTGAALLTHDAHFKWDPRITGNSPRLIAPYTLTMSGVTADDGAHPCAWRYELGEKIEVTVRTKSVVY